EPLRPDLVAYAAGRGRRLTRPWAARWSRRPRSGSGSVSVSSAQRVTGVAQRVLHVFAGLLRVGLGALGPTLGLEPFVVGLVADSFLRTHTFRPRCASCYLLPTGSAGHLSCRSTSGTLLVLTRPRRRLFGSTSALVAGAEPARASASR